MGLTSCFFYPSQPIKSLVVFFIVWKGFLLAVAAAASLVPDYDTSTSLFFDGSYGVGARVPALVKALTRWDALYFMQSMRRGYVFEQEWAFGAGLPVLARAVITVMPRGVALALEPVVIVGLVHLSHLIAILALHRLTIVIYNDAKLALVASALHVVSPAGLFLSAPYAESPFAAFSFIGFLIFAIGQRKSCRRAGRALATVGAGLVLGLATAFRSNGLASGLLFAVETIHCLVKSARRPSLYSLLFIAASVFGGVLVALGSVIPQAAAWKRYCRDSQGSRPWCQRTIPSIYTFVQREYWNVGFLRYWTLKQLPLFLLASPMLFILISSGLAMCRNPSTGRYHRRLVRSLAAVQTLVAVLAITNYHVQIINRLSSGFPVWYWWVAGRILDERTRSRTRAVVLFMVLYAGIQGGLFACFLPPA
ncbi:glycosyltransferase family 76 protein [Ophiocordyceps camponoti-floridani]|uniref:GPI mannosyltransferase 2 n=1 Tax=Ophiocordyceps camponoti-floridani TaxID=2030778 RepID=A0A8H4QE27_9HYPO|nr:glycosyltransferase family 76 protein [Ophiocordyceps camponoti-floridani]